MRYTEKKHIKFREEGQHIIESTIGVIISAPFTLVKEIGMKIPFLRRKTIEQILFFSIVIAAIMISLQIAIRLVMHNLNLLVGSITLVIQLIALVFLMVLYVIYELYDFKVYKGVDALLPLKKNEEKEQPMSDEEMEEVESIISSCTTDDALPEDVTTDATPDITETLAGFNPDEIKEDDLDLDISNIMQDFSPDISDFGVMPDGLGQDIELPDGLGQGIELPGELGQEPEPDTGTTEDLEPMFEDNAVVDYQERVSKHVDDILEFGSIYCGKLSTAEITAIEEKLAGDDMLFDEEDEILDGYEPMDDLDVLEEMKNWGIPSYFSM